MKARASVSVRHVDSAVEATDAGDAFRAIAPGKLFLEALLATFDALEQEQRQQQQQRQAQDESSSHSDGSFRRRVRRLSSTKRTAVLTSASEPSVAETGVNAGEFVLRINAQCLFYLQQLFRAMLVPVTSEQGLVKQWRINGMFLDELEDVEEVDLGPAGPRNILKLGGHMLEQTALIINGTSDEANLGAPGAFDLAFFPRLQHLRLDRCELADIQCLSVLRSRLKELRFHNRSIEELSSLLQPTEPESASFEENAGAGSMWTQLESLAVVNCSLTELDWSLELLPVVKTIRLSQNELSSIGHLQACPCLQELDLSLNRMSSMVGVNQILPQIISLDLSHNMLSSTAGLEKLFTLEVLNLSHNAISSISEVGYLVSLPNLHSLVLQGNPIESSPTYRSDVQKLLTNEVTLDGIPWTSQDVDDFAKQGELQDGESSRSSLILEHQTRVGGKLESYAQATSDQVYPSTANRVTVLMRSLLLAIAAIILVQGIVHLTWSRDIESERLLLKLLGSLAAVGMMVFTTFSILSWAVNRLIRRATVDVPVDTKAHRHNEGRFRRLSRRVSTCLVDETFVRRQAATADGTRRSNLGAGKLSVTVLQTSLQSLSESPEELSLLFFLNVCSELQTMIEFLSPTASAGDGGLVFAWNILAHSISTLETSAGDLRNATLQELLRDVEPQHHAPHISNDPVKAALQDTLRVFKFVAKFLLGLTSGAAEREHESGSTSDTSSNALVASLLSAYRHVFAQLHPWIVQKTIADAISAPSAPSRSAFYAALRRGNERVVCNDLILRDVLRTCGGELQACANVCDALVRDSVAMPNQ